jgi:hypothetical protein
MAFTSDKIMFEIYRDTGYSQRFKVVYFTELNDHNKDAEINRAMAGEHFFNGFIREYGKEKAKEAVNVIIERLNSGELLTVSEVKKELEGFLV